MVQDNDKPRYPPEDPTASPKERKRNVLCWCAGAVPDLLAQYPTEKTKYEGIGGAVLTTGILAFFSGFYAVYTTLAGGHYGLAVSILFAALWALAIFNLDRYIVCSIRKPAGVAASWRQRLTMTWIPAIPRLALAVLIGITLSKPLELQLFRSAIAGQTEINRDRVITTKTQTLRESYKPRIDEIEHAISGIHAEIDVAQNRLRVLEDEFRNEADGTGGSKKYGYSEVARKKEGAAVQARDDLEKLRNTTKERLAQLNLERDNITAEIGQLTARFREDFREDFLSKMTAMAELSATSPAVWWISGFITLLLIGIEMTPVLVKLMSPVGPYETAVEGIHTVAANEVALKCQTQMQIAEHHYGRILDAERRADDELHSVHVGLSEEQLQHKANQWKQAKAAGRGGTMEELLSSIRAEILTNRGTG